MAKCRSVLIMHRVTAPPWRADAGRVLVVQECPDPECTGDESEHTLALPCRWSWPYAHGKAFNGQQFPKRRCDGCAHIRRSGNPDQEVWQVG